MAALTGAFPAGFLFGCATSATQIEGGCDTTDWARFSAQPGRVAHGDTPAGGPRSWTEWPRDVALLAELRQGAYRYSLEWGRIEPVEGRFDDGALAVYRELTQALRRRAIEPMVTLLHFTLPDWLAARGGVLAAEFPGRFSRYVQRALEAVGDLCTLYVTINEPTVMAVQGYLFGLWPPGEKSAPRTVRACAALLRAHVLAYRLIHERVPRAQVGLAHHLRVAAPRRPGAARDRLAAGALDLVFNRAFPAAVARARAQDFFGLNYYTRDLVRAVPEPGQLFHRREVADGAAVTDLGWEIHPTGLGHLLGRVAKSGLPVYVTENGLADAADTQRWPFIESHLRELRAAIAAGVDVRGYFHWSLLDNFEWAEGWSPRFGLVAVDHATGARTVRPSAERYARVAADRRLA